MSDLIPNEGSFFIPIKDEEQARKLSQERAEALQVLPYLEKTVEWFELQAQEYEKLSNLNPESKVSLEAQIVANKEVAKALRLKKGELQSVISTYDIRQR